MTDNADGRLNSRNFEQEVFIFADFGHREELDNDWA